MKSGGEEKHDRRNHLALVKNNNPGVLVILLLQLVFVVHARPLDLLELDRETACEVQK